jgi:hypothetical protein
VLGLELRVVALPLGQALVRDVQHLGDGAVQELQVVADHQDGAGEALELVEQPALGRTVEMVGRLVQDHQLGLLEEHAHEVDPAPLAAREGFDVLQEELLAQTEAIGQSGHHRFGLVAPVALELLLQVGEELDVLRRRVVGHGLAGRAHRLVEHVEAAGREDVGETRWAPARGPRRPAPGGGTRTIPAADVAPMAKLRGRLTDDDGDERRFAGAVAADQADLLARSHDE